MNEYLLEKNTQLKVQPEDYIEEYLEFLKEFKIEKIDNIELNNKKQSENIVHNAINLMTIEKKNDINTPSKIDEAI